MHATREQQLARQAEHVGADVPDNAAGTREQRRSAVRVVARWRGWTLSSTGEHDSPLSRTRLPAGPWLSVSGEARSTARHAWIRGGACPRINTNLALGTAAAPVRGGAHGLPRLVKASESDALPAGECGVL